MIKRHFFSCLGWIIGIIFYIAFRKNQNLIKNELDENSFSHLPMGTCNNLNKQHLSRDDNDEKLKIFVGFDFLSQSEFNQYSRSYVRNYYSKFDSFDLTLRFFGTDSKRSVFNDFVKLRLDRVYNLKEESTFPWSLLLGFGLLTDPLDISIFDFDIIIILNLQNPVRIPQSSNLT